MAASTLEQRPLGAIGRMTIVAGIHLAVFYAIALGLRIVPPPVFAGSEMIEPIDTPLPDDPPPPTPPVVLERTEVFVPQPDLVIDSFPDTTITPEVRPLEQIPVEPMGGTAVTEVPGTNVMQDSRYPLTQPAYPPASKREGEQGAADVEVYVLPDGRVGNVRIARTTGFERLDNAALQEARRSWRFKPATRAGEAVAQWYKVRVVFKLTDTR